MKPEPDNQEAEVQDSANLAKRLKEAREYLGLSQEVVAKSTGLGRPTVSAIESGKRRLTVIELQQLAHLYRRPFDYFISPVEAQEEESVTALFRAAKDLSDADREQVVRFAEFLKHAGRTPTAKDE